MLELLFITGDMHCVCVSYSGSLLLSPVRPKLLDMASPEATETQSHTDRDREGVLPELHEINFSI